MTPIRVLHTVYPATSEGNPFVTLMIGALPSSEVRSSYFSWRQAFIRRWDVVHFQWPEKFFTGKSLLSRGLKIARFRLWLACLRIRGTAVVLTVHNLATHESVGNLAERELARLESRVDCFISLNPAVDLQRGPTPIVTIPHGSYRAVIPPGVRRPVSGRTLLYFGFIRDYKNVPRLLRAFSESTLSDEGYSLRVVGKPHSSDIYESVVAVSERPGTSVDLRALPDSVLYEEISASAAVVLPYTQLYNSGALLMALTLDRPVIAPRTAATEYYERRFGPSWVILYDGDLTAEALQDAVVRVARDAPRDPLELDDLDWSVLSGDYLRAYRTAIAQRR